MKKVNLFEFDFWSAPNLESIVDDVLGTTEYPKDKLPLLVTPNVDQIVKLGRSANVDLRRFIQRAYWVLPDGQPIVSLSRLKYGRKNALLKRLTGSDLFPLLWKQLLLSSDSKVMFIVPSSEIGERLEKERINTTYLAPPMFRLENQEETASILHEINQRYLSFQPDYIFVGLGFPKQEVIAESIFRFAEDKGLKAPKVLLLGASFEFYLGIKKRAPVFWQKLGLEFVHRLFSEPRRMFKRYIIDDSTFLGMAITELRRKNS